jgi:uncharacterized membrane protein
MILAAYRDTGYKFVLLLHIIAVLIAMAPAVAHPLMMTFEKGRTQPDFPGLASRMIKPARVYVIALAVAGILGFGLISMSDSAIGWGDAWVSISILLWLAINGLVHGMMLPAERKLAEGDMAGLATAEKIGRVISVLVIVLLYLMVVKPGGGGI